MNRTLLIFFIILISYTSCKNAEKSSNHLEIAEKFLMALNTSNGSEIKNVISDSLITSVPKYEYEVRYSKKDYVEKWLKWDSIFEPTYKVVEMSLENGTVKAKVLKTDQRILFFMYKPFLSNYTIKFKNNKIAYVEEEYLNFDEPTWAKNRSELLNWSKETHPELNLDFFINVQTEFGGIQLLKAIELYKNKK